MKPAIMLLFVSALALGQQKPKELPMPPQRPMSPQDTTVSRPKLVKLLQDQMETFQKNANAQLHSMQGQIDLLTVLKNDSVTVAKSLFR